ncbi:MAG TPA: hypothetical protein ENJ05_09890 [Thiotrichales bacterium]|nr:hypothetical protein [Thiotrichales bacterium]
MSERMFRTLFGALLLIGLYFDQYPLIWGLVGLLLFEGITNWRLPVVVCRLRGRDGCAEAGREVLPDLCDSPVQFEAERAWRFVVAGFLASSLAVFQEGAWFVPWFMGFAIFGAGLSGVCPVLVSLKLMGFR